MINQENITEYDKDFLDNKINIGDRVIFEAPGYRQFVLGKVITKAPKSCQIEYINDWNYEGRTEVVRQGYGQIIKYPSDLINRYKAEIERLQKDNSLFADIGKMYSEIKSEARKDFAKRLKKNLHGYSDSAFTIATVFREINDLLKEMERDGQ